MEEFVGKDACLGETVHVTAHFEVDPGVVGNLVELVLVNEFKGDVCMLDEDVLWLVKRGVQIEVLEIHVGKPGIAFGENTVDKQFYLYYKRLKCVVVVVVVVVGVVVVVVGVYRK